MQGGETAVMFVLEVNKYIYKQIKFTCHRTATPVCHQAPEKALLLTANSPIDAVFT